MVELIKHGVYLIDGAEIRTDATGLPAADEARENTITYGILRSHDVDGSKGKKMRIRFDAMGLMMGTRSGDVDPGALIFLMEKYNLTAKDLMRIVNKESGVLGITGISSDMREICDEIDKGNPVAKLAMDMYELRILKYIGAYAAELNGVDIIAFTGGVGENQTPTRRNICRSLEFLGVKIDEELNDKLWRGKEGEISTPDSKVKVVVVMTDEEYMIARDTEAIIEGREP